MTSLNAAWTTAAPVATVPPSPPVAISSIPDTTSAPTQSVRQPRPAAPPAAAVAVPTPDPTPRSTTETLKAIAASIESYVKSTGRSLEFHVDDASGLTVVTVRNSETGDLVRQIPSDEAVRIARSLGKRSNTLIDLEA